jgi:hypothetical protein
MSTYEHVDDDVVFETFPPVKAPSAYDSDYKPVRASRIDSMELQSLAIGGLVTAGLVVAVLAIGIFALAVK